jgi:16S rRNA (adenine1518-N6/adenine1519-N6)-dimethyltransferase
VQSEVIALDPFTAEQQLAPALAHRVESLLKMAFLSRRKMLRNSLATLGETIDLDNLAAAAGVDLKQRPQEVAPQAWVALAKGLNHSDASAPGS